MLLKNVLIVLEEYNRYITRKELYLMLFEPDTEDIDDQKFKNVFAKRPLTKRIYKWLCSDEGFFQLCQRIHSCYLRITGNHQSIYSGLCELVKEDPYLPGGRKAEIISSVDPDNEESVSRFIALCILCGNNNTNQNNDGITVGNGVDYGINLHNYINSLPTSVEYRLWKASQRDLLRTRMEGSRFSSLNIIQSLLPKGYIAPPHFNAKGIVDNGEPQQIIDLCHRAKEHMAVVGEGGIGKTTFLHQIMLEEYFVFSPDDDNEYILAEYKSGRPVPFFIELNRCPEKIKEWRNDTLQKSNFITRCIGQILEGHLSMDDVNDDTLALVEKEFQRTPEDGRPHYLLLLDGFNEVKSSEGHSIRSELSNEITVLSSYPNVRIVTTSRETQAAYFAARFKNVRLIGLEADDILTYLSECGMSETKIGLIKANHALMECLRIPLNVCMFCAEDESTILPETQGEIFYNFFHKDSAFYNIRSRAKDTRTNPLSDGQTAFVLDFVLPFIGWSLEHNDCFSASAKTIDSVICDSIRFVETACQSLDAVPYEDFGYETSVLLETARTLYMREKNIKRSIIDCIHGYLGILYLQQSDIGNFAERNRYAFCHHQFRDYFSAMWDIQMLSLLSCISLYPHTDTSLLNRYNDSIGKYVNRSFWSRSKTELISQVLMEHRNRPEMDGRTGRWRLPKPILDEQMVLKKALDFCRGLARINTDSHFLLQNILSAIVAGRDELSGEGLCDLDFRSCNLFQISCSRTGIANTLAADFRGSYLYEKCFEPEGHQDEVIDFLYRAHFCYTIDRVGCIKCWDVHSGKMEYSLQSDDPIGLYDYAAFGFLKLSADRRWLAAKIQNSTQEGIEVGVNLVKLDTQGYVSVRHKITIPAGIHKTLDSFFFTGDSEGILLLCDKTVVYCYDLNERTLCYKRECHMFVQGTILYAPNTHSAILAFTGDYDPLEWEDWYTENYLENGEEEDAEYEDDGMENEEVIIPCYIYELPYDSDDYKELYYFAGMDGISPTVEYISEINGFLLFHYNKMQMELFACDGREAVPVFPEIVESSDMPPAHFHPHASHPGEYFIMYPGTCYLVDLSHPDNPEVVMKYFIDGVAKLLPEGDTSDELYFKTSVAPVNGRFLVTNDRFVYEWDSEDDSLLPRYNVAYYEVADLISDRQQGEVILVHQNNGLTIFEGAEFKLKDAVTFHEEGYNVTGSCLEPKSQNLALTFTRPDHEKILLLNLASKEQKYCFSTRLPNETVIDSCYSETGEYFLIVTQYKCYEYELSSDLLLLVQSAGKRERYVGGNYCEDNIEIAIVPNKISDENSVVARCECYSRKEHKDGRYYSLKGYYILPELSDDLYQGFVYPCFDFGVQGSVDENGMQSYWVTRGFFYPPEEGVLEFNLPEITCYTSARKHGCRKHEIEPLQMIYFRHTHVLNYRYKQYNGSNVSYIYLDEGTGQAVFIENTQNIFYCPDYRKTSYREIWNGYKKKTGSYNGKASWSFIIPWSENRLVCCYEGFLLAILDAETGEELQLIDYTPGMAVVGCDFRKAILEGELREELLRNGGRV